MERVSSRRLFTAMAIWITRAVGGFFLAFGLLGMLTPIPFGLIFFVIGLLMLIPTVPAVARPVRYARRKIGLFDRLMFETTRRLPVPYRRILRQTEIGS